MNTVEAKWWKKGKAIQNLLTPDFDRDTRRKAVVFCVYVFPQAPQYLWIRRVFIAMDSAQPQVILQRLDCQFWNSGVQVLQFGGVGDIGFLNFGRGSNLAKALCCLERRWSPHQNLLDDNSKKLSQSNQSFHVLNLRILGTSRVLDIKKRERKKAQIPLHC